MDPVGPWSAYAASYNRLANASGFQNASSSELHHHMGSGVQAVPSSTSQLLAAHASSGLASSAASPFNPTGFLSPPPVGYDPVFTPLFHQKAHYGIQPRPIKQVEPDSYNQMTPNNFYEQNNAPSIPWTQNSPQLPSPFGILPHESVVANSASATPKTYDNFNAHFAAAQSLNQLTEYKNSSFTDPKKRAGSPPKTSSTAPFFQQMFTTNPESNAQFKQNDYMAKNFQNGHNQSSCNVASPPSTNSKEYRVPQLPQRPQFPQQRNEKPRSYTPKQSSQKQPKLYETEKRNENESQSSPISYAMMDSQRGFQSTKLRSQQYQHIPNQQTYRFPMTPESDYQRSKSTESFGSTSSNPECNIGMPRRPSPLQAQPSPTIPAQSPVYPMYNSPLTTISSPSPVQHESCYNKQQEVTPPLDVTVSRNSISNSVITRIDSRYDRQDYNRQQWDDRRRYSGYENQNIQSRQQYYDPGNQVSLQDLSSCRGDPMSLVKNLQQQQPEKPAEEAPKKRKKSVDKKSDADYVPRVPPPAHHNGGSLANQNGYSDLDRWNISSASNKIYSPPPAMLGTQSSVSGGLSNEPSSLVTPHPGPPMTYYPAYDVPQPETPETTPETTETENTNQRKVIVPNIVQELQCLLDGSVTEETLYRKPLGPNPNEGFMASFVKFLQGEKETSPSPDEMSPRPTKKKLYQPSELSNEKAPTTPIPEFPADPEDDPRYFPLPKSSEKRNFNSSDSDYSDHEINADTLEKNEESSSMNNDQPHSSQQDSKIEKRKKKKKDKKHKKKKKSKRQESPEAVVPRRELSRRKAKEKNSYCLIDEVDIETQIPELHGSDSDPSWSQEEGSDETRVKRNRRISTRKKSKTTFKESSDEDDPTFLSEPKPVKRRISISASKKPSEKLSKKPPPQIIYPSKSTGKSNNFPFNIGEFVVMKSDTHLRHPPIWKVTEKTMLQKFLHFVHKGISFYQNLRFFTGWSPQNKYVYEGVIVKIITINKQETIVELLSDDIHEMEPDDRAVVNKIVEDTSTYSENFEIYIQSLISQALDSNFLNEVFQEHDEYFLLNLRAIDTVVSDLEKRLCEAAGWSEELVNAIQSFSSYKGQQKGGHACHCENPGIQLIILSGTTYNKDTLETDLLSSPSSHEVVVCRSCLTILEALHSLSHFKHSLYSICEAKVNERREEDLEKDTSIILNEMLADETWLSQLFNKIRREWGYTEALIEKLKNPTPVQE